MPTSSLLSLSLPSPSIPSFISSVQPKQLHYHADNSRKRKRKQEIVKSQAFLADRTASATQYDRLLASCCRPSVCPWTVHCGSQGWCTGLKVVPACSYSRNVPIWHFCCRMYHLVIKRTAKKLFNKLIILSEKKCWRSSAWKPFSTISVNVLWWSWWWQLAYLFLFYPGRSNACLSCWRAHYERKPMTHCS